MKKQQFVLWFCILVLAYHLTGCTPVYYATNAHNVPLLQDKNEVRLNLGFSSTEDAAGPDVQAAYAVGENIGIMANGAYFNNSTSSSWQGSGYLAEAGVGYFGLPDDWWVAEVYTGAGIGRITNQRQNSPYNTLELDFTKCFVQPALGFSSDYFEIAVSSRVALVYFREPILLESEWQTDAQGNSVLQVIRQKQSFLAFEPGITMRGGWKYVMLQLQAIRSEHDIPNAQKLTLNLSLSLALANRFRKIPK